ncbi:MAG: type III CRISPR-associated RAMP protein Csx7 [bacterium]
MTTTLSRAKLDARHHVQGALVLDTALHLGGGRNPAKGTDSPIVRDGYGRPYIPGSSLKGAIRATVERMVPNFGISACGLYDRTAKCLTALPETDAVLENFRAIQEALGRPFDSSIDEKFEVLLDGSGNSLSDLPDRQEVTEADLIFLLDLHLCDVCKAFGSPFIGAAIFFHDASIVPEQWVGLTQVRDGVGIDRDSGRAVEGLKYDYEIVPPQTAFNFSLTIETDAPLALGLAALALHEMVQGNIPLGGIRSRGLGRCHLDPEKTEVNSLRMNDLEALKAYLTTNKIQPESVEKFIQQHISNLWTAKEGNHV